ncbi:DUF2653 family protein [Peribacillus kribbensis]|uniref:DUF2653 family protein n=1 Tax=Peribacillus kribbensis TaxID=356658 RepID=UPI0004020B6B|nr:DUF2653 family protein [Peribacillus kribbensis]
MILLLSEQDIADSICVYVSMQEAIGPESVRVNLQYQEGFGFSAMVTTPGGSRSISEQEMIDSIAVYLQEYHSFIPERLFIDLSFTEKDGIGASVQVTG